MEPQTLPTNTPVAPPQLDPVALTLTKAIAYQENGGKPDIANLKPGASGELPSIYQYTPDTWKAVAGKYLGNPDAPVTPENENQATYLRVKDWLDQGYSPAQIASMHNAGEGAPNAYLGNKGVNKEGVSYDTAAYAKGVQSYAEQLWNEQNGQQPTAAQLTSNVPQPASQPSLGGFAGNVVSSGANFLGNLGNAALHPIQTAETLGSIPVGALQELGGQTTANTQNFDALKSFYAQRYGSPQAILQTIYKDPVGFLADLSTVAAGGAGALGVAGKGAELAGATDAAAAARAAGGIASRAADLTNPLQPIISGVKGAANLAATEGSGPIAQGIGSLTGSGGDAVTALQRAAAQGGETADAARSALRGEISPNEIVNEAYGAVQRLSEKQSADYQAQLAKIGDINSSLDISPVYKTLDTQLSKFGIGVNEDGSLDFSRSTISPGADAQKVQQAYNIVKSWGSQQGDRTPLGVDTLKRKLGNLYNGRTDGKPVSAFLTPIKQSARKVLSDVPGYDKMTADYTATENLLDEIKGTFSLSGRAKTDTVFRKIIGALRSNDALRTEMLSTLSDIGGQNLEAKVAGASFSPYIARGLRGSLVEGGALFAAINGLLSPQLIGVAMATSPRIMGEFIMALGGKTDQANKFVQALSLLKQIAPAAAQSSAALSASPTEQQDQQIPSDTSAPTPGTDTVDQTTL